jgi:hypothetical protein
MATKEQNIAATEVRRAVADLNLALSKAARSGLHVSLDAIETQQLGCSDYFDTYTAEIEIRERL